jgi:hypothetical protein
MRLATVDPAEWDDDGRIDARLNVIEPAGRICEGRDPQLQLQPRTGVAPAEQEIYFCFIFLKPKFTKNVG